MTTCSCNTGTRIIYSCSGAADVGELSDRAVRALRKEGFAQGSCIAAIGADLSGYIESAKGADVLIAVDGCGMACAKKNLERIDVDFVAVNLADFGFKKGESPCSDELVVSAADHIRKAVNC